MTSSPVRPFEDPPPAITRWTKPTVLVLTLLIQRHLADPLSESWGFEVAKATGLKSTSTYPILHRLQRAGWLLTRDEEINNSRDSRTPPRTFFRINPDHLGTIRQGLAEYNARQHSADSKVPGGTTPAAGQRLP